MCVPACLCVFFYICPQPCSKLGETPISPALLFPAAFPPYSRQCEEETWLILGWSLSSHPASHFPFFLLSLSLCIPVIWLCAWFSSLDWLTWESQWHHCPQAKTRLDERRHTFLPLSLPRWVPHACVWSYLCLPITGDTDWVSAAEDCLS